MSEPTRIELHSSTPVDFGRRLVFDVSAAVPKGGGSIGKMYVRIRLPRLTTGLNYVDFVGLRLLRGASLVIGNTMYDRDSGLGSYIWNQVSSTDIDTFLGQVSNSGNEEEDIVCIPLQFFCCRHESMALPADRIREQITVNIDLAPSHECIDSTHDFDWHLLSGSLFVEFASTVPSGDGGALPDSIRSIEPSYPSIDPSTWKGGNGFLGFSSSGSPDPSDSPENLEMEMDIEQIAEYQTSIGSRHCCVPVLSGVLCKEVFWVVQCDDFAGSHYGNQLFNFTTQRFVPEQGTTPRHQNPVIWAVMGTDEEILIPKREGEYFNFVVPFERHRRVPDVGINCFSFGFSPETAESAGARTIPEGAKFVMEIADEVIAGTRCSKVTVFTLHANRMRIGSDGKCSLVYPNMSKVKW